MFEEKTIQDRLQNNDRVTTNNNKESLTFAQVTEEGKVNKAIKILEKANKEGILPLSEERFEILQEKILRLLKHHTKRILLKETPQ